MKVIEKYICIVAMFVCYYAFVMLVWLVDLGRKMFNKLSLLERWSNCW